MLITFIMGVASIRIPCFNLNICSYRIV